MQAHATFMEFLPSDKRCVRDSNTTFAPFRVVCYTPSPAARSNPSLARPVAWASGFHIRQADGTEENQEWQARNQPSSHHGKQKDTALPPLLTLLLRNRGCEVYATTSPNPTSSCAHAMLIVETKMRARNTPLKGTPHSRTTWNDMVWYHVSCGASCRQSDIG